MIAVSLRYAHTGVSSGPVTICAYRVLKKKSSVNFIVQMFVHFVTELSTEPVNRDFYDASLKEKNTEITNKTFNT